jgi:hypothetical protein
MNPAGRVRCNITGLNKIGQRWWSTIRWCGATHKGSGLWDELPGCPVCWRFANESENHVHQKHEHPGGEDVGAQR